MSDLDEPMAPYTPPRRVRAAIGDIIIAGAEIDHLITIALFKVAEIDYKIGFALLDRASIGTKLAKLKYFVDLSKDQNLQDNFGELKKGLETFLTLQNTLAHGIIVGKDKVNDKISWLVSSEYTDKLGSFCGVIKQSTETQLNDAAESGVILVRLIKKILSVRPLHEMIQYTVLGEKPTSLKESRKQKMAKDPPRSKPY